MTSLLALRLPAMFRSRNDKTAATVKSHKQRYAFLTQHYNTPKYIKVYLMFSGYIGTLCGHAIVHNLKGVVSHSEIEERALEKRIIDNCRFRTLWNQ